MVFDGGGTVLIFSVVYESVKKNYQDRNGTVSMTIVYFIINIIIWKKVTLKSKD